VTNAMTTSTIDVNGGPIAITTTDATLPWHTAPETILFHHGLGASQPIWRRWTAALIEDYRLVAFDMRGHGITPVPEGYQWSLENSLADLAAVIDATGRDKIHLVGESIGGTIVLAYAARFPGRVASLTISNGTHKGGAIENLKSWQDIIAKGGMPAWSAHMMKERFYAGVLSTGMAQWYETQQASADAKSILAAAAMLAGADLTAELGKVTVPTLLLHPDNSPFIPVPVMAELHSLLPNSRLEIFADTRHGLPFSHATRCSRTLRRFLGSLAQNP